MDTVTSKLAEKPAHVPDNLVRDFDRYEGPVRGQSHYPDIHREWKAFQDANPPVFWTPHNGGHWAIMTYDLVQEAALKPGTFSNRDIFIPQGTSPFLAPSNPEHPKAWADLSTYVAGRIEIRRKEPGDDFLSHMLTSTVVGRPLTDAEMFSMALLVIAGGLDTVAISIGFATAFLAQNPDHCRALIANPEMLDKAIDEFLRRFGISSIGRVVAHDTEFHGAQMREGDSVLLMFPLTVAFNRKVSRHLIFGTGPHTCIGNRLGKREIKLFLEEWLQRIPDFALAPGKTPKVTAGVVNNLEELHLVWGV